MEGYHALSVERFYSSLKETQILLRRSDIEFLLKNIAGQCPDLPETLLIQKVYDAAVERFAAMSKLRKKADTVPWDSGIERRVTSQ